MSRSHSVAIPTVNTEQQCLSIFKILRLFYHVGVSTLCSLSSFDFQTKSFSILKNILSMGETLEYLEYNQYLGIL